MNWDAQKVEVDQHRWYVNITITDKTGERIEMVADASINAGDAIWFGSRDEHEKAMWG